MPALGALPFHDHPGHRLFFNLGNLLPSFGLTLRREARSRLMPIEKKRHLLEVRGDVLDAIDPIFTPPRSRPR